MNHHPVGQLVALTQYRVGNTTGIIGQLQGTIDRLYNDFVGIATRVFQKCWQAVARIILAIAYYRIFIQHVVLNKVFYHRLFS